MDCVHFCTLHQRCSLFVVDSLIRSRRSLCSPSITSATDQNVENKCLFNLILLNLLLNAAVSDTTNLKKTRFLLECNQMIQGNIHLLFTVNGRQIQKKTQKRNTQRRTTMATEIRHYIQCKCLETKTAYLRINFFPFFKLFA